MLFQKKKSVSGLKWRRSVEPSVQNKTKKLPHKFGGTSPSARKYAEKCTAYGKPVRGGLDGEPSINAYGIAVFPDGTNFVQDCMTGDIIERDSSVKYLGSHEGTHFYLGALTEFDQTAKAIPSFAE